VLLEELDSEYMALDGDDKSAGVGRVLHRIGFVHDRQGWPGLALEYYGKALEVRLAKLGDAHPDVAAMYNNIAVVHAS
jgi:hypothetical protein